MIMNDRSVSKSGIDAKLLIKRFHLAHIQGWFWVQVFKFFEGCMWVRVHNLRTRRRRFWKYSKRNVEGWQWKQMTGVSATVQSRPKRMNHGRTIINQLYLKSDAISTLTNQSGEQQVYHHEQIGQLRLVLAQELCMMCLHYKCITFWDYIVQRHNGQAISYILYKNDLQRPCFSGELVKLLKLLILLQLYYRFIVDIIALFKWLFPSRFSLFYWILFKRLTRQLSRQHSTKKNIAPIMQIAVKLFSQFYASLFFSAKSCYLQYSLDYLLKHKPSFITRQQCSSQKFIWAVLQIQQVIQSIGMAVICQIQLLVSESLKMKPIPKRIMMTSMMQYMILLYLKLDSLCL